MSEIFILTSSHLRLGLPNGLFLHPTKKYAFPMRATRPAHLNTVLQCIEMKKKVF